MLSKKKRDETNRVIDNRHLALQKVFASLEDS